MAVKVLYGIKVQHNYSCVGRLNGLYFYSVLLYTTGWKALKYYKFIYY
jgi:hypothetical protein